jgi:SAM-dependent methyltransferase
MQEMYVTDAYQKNNPTWHEEDSPWKAGHIQNMIIRNRLTANSICEVGCGTGEILLNLEKDFPNASLSGYEIAPQAFDRAVIKQTDRTKFYLEDALERDDPPFDVVLAIDVMEHVEDYLGFLKKIKPMGMSKIFHIPLDLSVQSVARSRPILELRKGVGHIHYFYKDTALAALADCGYSIVDWIYTASRLELPNQARSSRIMRVPRRLLYAANRDLAVRLLGGYSLLVLAE